MNFALAGAIADAILFEGYMLYPYRRSALKNRAGWTLGVLLPRVEGRAASQLRCECLVVGGSATEVEGRLRCLLPLPATANNGQHAVPFELNVPPIRVEDAERRTVVTPFSFAHADERVEGRLELSAARAAEGVDKLTITVTNISMAPTEDGRAQARSMVSTHVLLGLRDGEFVPLREPSPALFSIAESCRQDGLWPILIGERGQRDLMIASPMILDDYPQIAPESPTSLFDGTEIDEILTLRILTMADDEREEIAAGDPRVRALLARAETLGPTELARLHGTMRSTGQGSERPRTLRVGDRDLGAGDRVRLHPTKRSDVMDLVLTGRLATIVSVEQDYDQRSYFAVTVDGDPGEDLGALGQVAHRFFFGPDEVRPVP
jgi:hypothetical protein